MNPARPPQRNRAVTLHIERLVIDCPGIGRTEAGQIERTMRTELARLADLRAKALPASGGSLPDRAARPVKIGASASPTELGRAAARSLFDALVGRR